MKKVTAVIAMMLLICLTATGCTEASQVSYNISKEANNFNVRNPDGSVNYTEVMLV